MAEGLRAVLAFRQAQECKQVQIADEKRQRKGRERATGHGDQVTEDFTKIRTGQGHCNSVGVSEVRTRTWENKTI